MNDGALVDDVRWFVLKYLLSYPGVKNYDGSWTEWGNIIANLIEK